MVHHDWSDSDFDWNALAEAADFISKYVEKHSFCTLIQKEKYGSLRYEYVFPPKGSVRVGFQIRLPFFTRKNRFFPEKRAPICLWSWQDSWLYRKWTAYGWECVLKACLLAVDKYPHIKDEILQDVCCNEGLVGKEMHDKYWSATKEN